MSFLDFWPYYVAAIAAVAVLLTLIYKRLFDGDAALRRELADAQLDHRQLRLKVAKLEEQLDTLGDALGYTYQHKYEYDSWVKKPRYGNPISGGQSE